MNSANGATTWDTETSDPYQVVVTAPSSPEIQQSTPTISSIFVPDARISLHPEYAGMQSPEGDTIGSVTGLLPSSHQYPPSRFDELLASSDMPDPGPAYFKARRALWLTPVAQTDPPTRQRTSLHPNLQALLEGPTHSLCEVSNWNGGIGRICQRLLSGESLANRLPLRHVTKLLHANWVLNDLWPKGQMPPSSDEDISQIDSNGNQVT